jgi:GWxTD domain-containing protein
MTTSQKICKNWIDEDVRWITTDEERADFKKLASDKQRDDFVVAFWERRNADSGSPKNEFKEEHYRRLAYANTHFAGSIPGWKTDRGRVYIMGGTPDRVDSNPAFSPPSEAIPTLEPHKSIQAISIR